MANIIKKIFDFFASIGLSCVLFLFLLLLTYLGTLYQVEHGLYEAQKKYFESFFLIHYAFGAAPIPLPGTYLLLVVFFLNMVCGAIVKARKGWSKLGILIAHGGIIVLLVGSFVTFTFSTNGNMMILENEQSDYFESSHDWEITVSEVGSSQTPLEYVITQEEFGVKGSRTFAFPDVPFELSISNFMKNSMPMGGSGTAGSANKVIDGFYLAEQPPAQNDRPNIAGAYAKLKETSSGSIQEGIIWGGSQSPFIATVSGRKWAVDMHKQRWQLPFTVVLKKFTHEKHPRTNMPKVFRSDITRIENGLDQEIEISMNAPMRHKGYTFFQSSYQPGPNNRMYSVFSVVKNPADKAPLYSCIIITFGMTLHFMQKLFRYLKKENAKLK